MVTQYLRYVISNSPMVNNHFLGERLFQEGNRIREKNGGSFPHGTITAELLETYVLHEVLLAIMIYYCRGTKMYNHRIFEESNKREFSNILSTVFFTFPSTDDLSDEQIKEVDSLIKEFSDYVYATKHLLNKVVERNTSG